MSVKTRFAPSPTGLIHLGNARTALFNALLAQRAGGAFVLRIEDTDRERSRKEYVTALEEDLHWLGLGWQEGPRAGAHEGPYRQSQRSDVYCTQFARLEAAGRAYPCFCSPRELDLSRKAQRAAGLAPRYAGTCAHLSPVEVRARLDRGLAPTLRFRVARGASIEFDDLVKGPQRFASDDIGDFIVRRADGTAAFFFSNAVDDALMGITDVLRGEDHLTNTPRQLMLLEALGLPAPRYGHIALILGPDGLPLSKRNGSRSLRDLREMGFLPDAVNNYLARLGHVYAEPGFLDREALVAGFELGRLGRAPARHDNGQLLYWQKEALARASDAFLWEWMAQKVRDLVPPDRAIGFVQTVRENVTFPNDARSWAERLFTEGWPYARDAESALLEAGAGFFTTARELLPNGEVDFKVFARAVGGALGVKGKALFMPLRAALTGETHGPELVRILRLLGTNRARHRLERAARLAAGTGAGP
jgi:glutamyl-tRNA synthetase